MHPESPCRMCQAHQLARFMHAHPDPAFHRIHWPTIIRDAHNPRKWFLVDWDGSSTSPTKAAIHLNARSHSPAVFKDNHGAEVDIWAVGKLIVDAVTFTSDIPAALVEVGKRMIEGWVTTATQGLVEIQSVIFVIVPYISKRGVQS